MKKLLALVLALAMLCASSALAVEPLVEGEPAKLSVGLKTNAKVTDYENNALTKYLEETLNVDLEFVFFPSSSTEARQKVDLMVAAKQELPDVLLDVGLTDTAVLSFGEMGVLVPLNDYMDKAVNWKAGMEKWATPEEEALVIKSNTAADGNMYAFPFYYMDPNDLFCRGMYINTTWLDKLGLEIPTTTDELYDVLVAFRDQDPNGNGLKDEIPMIGTTGWSGDPVQIILNSFIYYSDYYLNAEDGVLSAPFIQDDFREGLRYVAKLVNEGLLSPLSFTQGNNELKAILENGDADCVVGVSTVHSGVVFNPNSEKLLDFEGIAPVAGPEGIAYAYANVIEGKKTSYITSSAEDPELAFRFLDALCDTTTSMSIRFGEYGVDWTWAEEGAVNKQQIEGYEAVYNSDDIVWNSSSTDKIWGTNAITLIPPKLFGGMAYPEAYFTEYTEDMQKAHDMFWNSVPKRHGKAPAELVGNLIYTAEELEQTSEMWSTIKSYVDESITRFATGDLDIEKDWDSYVANLENMGLSYFMEVAQTAYDRMNGK